MTHYAHMLTINPLLHAEKLYCYINPMPFQVFASSLCFLDKSHDSHHCQEL